MNNNLSESSGRRFRWPHAAALIGAGVAAPRAAEAPTRQPGRT